MILARVSSPRLAALAMDKGGVAVAPAPAGSSAASGKKAKRFDIKKWNAVSLWAWGTGQSTHVLSLIDFCKLFFS